MSTPEHDVELIEQYLDSELSPEQAEQLRLRAATDPSLNATMHRLNRQRALRKAYFQTLEPSPQDVQTLETVIEAQLLRQRRWAGRARILRRLTAAAACVIMGMGVGWLGRSVLTEPDHRLPEHGVPAAIGGTSTISQSMVGSEDFPILRSYPWSDGDGYKVALTDAFGRVIAIRRFQTLDQAMEFSRRQDPLPTRINPFDLLPPELRNGF